MFGFSTCSDPEKLAGDAPPAGGKLSVTDGPFSETKEVVGGWAIMQGRSKDEVLAVSRRFMELHQQYWPGWEGTSELYEMEAYGDGP